MIFSQRPLGQKFGIAVSVLGLATLIFSYQNCGNLQNTGSPEKVKSSSNASNLSPSGTTIPSASQIIDGQNNIWTLVNSNGPLGNQIAENGEVNPVTQLVTLLLYFNGVVYQETSVGAWWGLYNNSWLYITGDPRGSISSANGATIPSSPFLTDASGNTWTLVPSGGFSGTQIAQNGVVSSYTSQVILLLYYDDEIFQETSSGNWYEYNPFVSTSWLQTSSDPR